MSRCISSRPAPARFPPEHTPPANDTAVPPASTAQPPAPAAPPLTPRPRRTLFAVTLQVGRCFGTLCALVRAGFERDRTAVVRHALTIADAILFGARDRSRDQLLRSLYDQQQRSDSLHEPRPERPRPKKAPASGNKALT